MPPHCPTEELKKDLVAILLQPLDLPLERTILRKRGEQQPLRDSPTLSSYGIVDGSALDFEVIGLENEGCEGRGRGGRGRREIGKGVGEGEGGGD